MLKKMNIIKFYKRSFYKPIKYFTTETKFDNKFDFIYHQSINPKTREQFWEEESKEVAWFKKFDKVLDDSNIPHYRWFPGGKINMSYNCIDRHIENGLENFTSIIWDCAYINKVEHISYSKLLENVCKLANLLVEKGVKKGDVVIIYMPMIPEALYAMLACSRLGAIHSVIFGGFAYAELARRIENSSAKLIITASAGMEPKKTIIYLPIIEKALNSINRSVPILLVQRPEVYLADIKKSKHEIFDYKVETNKMKPYIKPVHLDSNDPLYILYTSGSTGDPKGVVRDIGGTCVGLNFSSRAMFGINKKDVFFSSSDIGWIVGHNYTVYGPLIRGATTVLYEGKPVSTPNSSKYWEMIENYKVNAFFTSITALKSIRKEDEYYKIMRKHKLSSLKVFHLGGERCDPNTFSWLQNGIGKDILINDILGQTESGCSIASNNLEYYPFKSEPGSVCKPAPGYDVRIDDENHKELKPFQEGKIFIKLPMPPAFMTTLWGNKEGFLEKYITSDNQYYMVGDSGYLDDKGFLFVLSRVDDIIKVASHRLSTGRLEEVLIQSQGIIEAAVVGKKDNLKGEVPFAFVVMSEEVKKDQYENLLLLGKQKIVDEIGAIARLNNIIVLQRFPKTKSGKVIRNLLKKILNNETYSIPPTIETPHNINEIVDTLKLANIIQS